MDQGIALYPVRVPGLPHDVRVYAGTNYPASGQQHAFSVFVELPQELDARQGRRMLAQIYRALHASIEENRKWDAAARLTGNQLQDAPGALPWSRPGKLEAHCFWVKVAEHEQPVLGIRTHFEAKNKLKALFDQLWNDADGKRTHVARTWWPEAKLWWLAAPHAYPRFLGLLRQNGYKLKWIQRADMPPAPPVETMP